MHLIVVDGAVVSCSARAPIGYRRNDYVLIARRSGAVVWMYAPDVQLGERLVLADPGWVVALAWTP